MQITTPKSSASKVPPKKKQFDQFLEEMHIFKDEEENLALQIQTSQLSQIEKVSDKSEKIEEASKPLFSDNADIKIERSSKKNP